MARKKRAKKNIPASASASKCKAKKSENNMENLKQSKIVKLNVKNKMKKKYKEKQYSEESLKNALKVVESGKSLRQAASIFGVPKSTLHLKLNSDETTNSIKGAPTILTKQEENEIPCIQTSIEQSNSVDILSNEGFEHIHLPVIAVTSEIESNPSSTKNVQYIDEFGHQTTATIISVPSKTTQDGNTLDLNTFSISEADLLDQDLFSNLISTEEKRINSTTNEENSIIVNLNANTHSSIIEIK